MVFEPTRSSPGEYVSGPSNEPPRRPNTLKDRIKRAMASDASHTHANSVLTAASALTSLGTEAADEASKNADLQVGRNSPPLGVLKPDTSLPQPLRLENDVPMTFPQKLMEVLSNERISNIITWLPHGKGFIILQKRKFATDVMPLYFKHSKFTSFTRKLNRWGFTRVTRGPETGAYYHKFFQRDNHLLCVQMHCQSTKSSGYDVTTTESPRSPAATAPGMAAAMSALQLGEAGSTAPSALSRDRNLHLSGNSFAIMQPAHIEPNDNLSRHLQGSSVQNRSALERALLRQQELLHEEQKLRMLADQHHPNHPQNFGPRHDRGPTRLQHARPNVAGPLGFDKLVGLTSASSPKHPLVIQAALNALQTCNDRAYLTMLMTKEHNKTEAAVRDAVISSAEIQSRVHAAMQAQMRQLEEYNRRTSGPKNHGAAPIVTPNHVARLHKEISHHRGLTQRSVGTHPDASQKGRYPPGVRRASAA